jgi:oligopeptide/dipeptide ABC transporter ATP-binding protein
MTTVLKTENLNKTYRLGGFFNRLKINALDEVNLTVESDKPVIISLVGESGSGKTTLAKVMLRLVEPTSGSAMIYGHQVAGEGTKTSKQEFLSSVQPIFQNPFEAFSAYRTVDAYLQRTATRISGLSDAQAVIAMEGALASVGLKYADVKGKYPNQFSGGELQRVSVARALIPRPEIIIADEPVSMIDASMRMNVINLFLSIKEQYNTSFLYITHDLATAYYVSDYIAVMYRGTIVEFGEAKGILRNPQHPYTQLLLNSVAMTNRKWERKTFAASDIEAKEFQLEGCRFYNRCPLAEDICKHERPQPVRLPDNREVYCHFAEKNYVQLESVK